MVKVKRTSISMTRGDTLRVLVSIEKDGEPYTPQQGDELKFFLKHNELNRNQTEYNDPEPLIEKTIPIDTMLLTINPEDTKPLGFGNYVYDIQLTYNEGTVDTFINNADFELVPEVG